jgi:L-ascorbate metabolism protein UlaG (beta-lactamase superfamily)
MIYILVFLALLVAAFLLFINNVRFGAAPTGARLERMKQSPNYRNGQFQNVEHTPSLKKGHSFGSILIQFLFGDKPRNVPKGEIPAQQTNLKTLPLDQNVLVWFGHSGYYMQIDGKRFLVDPTLSAYASPIPRSNKAFKAGYTYTSEDIPEIDYLLITHDHYDHLDYGTMQGLRDKVRHIITPLGVGSHLERWGFDTAIIKEYDWDAEITLADSLKLFTTTARHFSGRKFKRNETLWMSFVLESAHLRLFLGGDSGYGQHFQQIGQKFGPFDWVLLENGQYNEAWHYIHLLPEEVIRAAQDLKAKRLIPVHAGKFALAFHPWDESLIKVSENAARANLSIATPRIGEPVYLDRLDQAFQKWWIGIP